MAELPLVFVVLTAGLGASFVFATAALAADLTGLEAVLSTGFVFFTGTVVCFLVVAGVLGVAFAISFVPALAFLTTPFLATFLAFVAALVALDCFAISSGMVILG
ncbi:MAG: hypothetical protein WAO76_16405 [Georgfuchsia sp.]